MRIESPSLFEKIIDFTGDNVKCIHLLSGKNGGYSKCYVYLMADDSPFKYYIYTLYYLFSVQTKIPILSITFAAIADSLGG